MCERKKRRKKHYLLRIIIIIALAAGAYALMHIDYFMVDGIAVIGNREISDRDIMHISGIRTGESIFDVHPFIAQKKVKNNLYIEEVNVNRKLPDKVEIIVRERTGNAQLKKGRKYAVIASDFTVIEITETEKKTTLIENVTADEAEVGQEIKVREEENFRKAMKLIKRTENNDLFFKRVKVEGTKVEAHVYDDLICRGSYDNIMGAIKSGALKTVIYDLYQKGSDKGTIEVQGGDYCFFTPKK